MAQNAHLQHVCLKVLATIGPVSWLLLGLYLLTIGQQMWVGLAALYYGLPIILVIHIMAPLGILWLTHHRGYPTRRSWVRWSLTYYALVPGIVIGLSIWFQGITGTLESMASLLCEIRFQWDRAGWER
jgi:hypothetical protein